MRLSGEDGVWWKVAVGGAVGVEGARAWTCDGSELFSVVAGGGCEMGEAGRCTTGASAKLEEAAGEGGAGALVSSAAITGCFPFFFC